MSDSQVSAVAESNTDTVSDTHAAEDAPFFAAENAPDTAGLAAERHGESPAVRLVREQLGGVLIYDTGWPEGTIGHEVNLPAAAR